MKRKTTVLEWKKSIWQQDILSLRQLPSFSGVQEHGISVTQGLKEGEKSRQSTGSLCVYFKDGLAWSGGFFVQDWCSKERGWGLDFFPMALFVLSNWQVFLSIGEKSRHCPVALSTHPIFVLHLKNTLMENSNFSIIRRDSADMQIRLHTRDPGFIFLQEKGCQVISI